MVGVGVGVQRGDAQAAREGRNPRWLATAKAVSPSRSVSQVPVSSRLAHVAPAPLLGAGRGGMGESGAGGQRLNGVTSLRGSRRRPPWADRARSACVGWETTGVGWRQGRGRADPTMARVSRSLL